MICCENIVDITFLFNIKKKFSLLPSKRKKCSLSQKPPFHYLLEVIGFFCMGVRRIEGRAQRCGHGFAFFLKHLFSLRLLFLFFFFYVPSASYI